MPYNKIYIKNIFFITLPLLIMGCGSEQPEPCRCDIFDEKESYFIKNGSMVMTNSSDKAIREGKTLELEITANTSAEDIAQKISKLDIGTKVIVPYYDSEKYYSVFEVNRTENTRENNMILYFLMYCSKYPIYHKKDQNCEPDNQWGKIVDDLEKKYISNPVLPSTGKEENTKSQVNKTAPKNSQEDNQTEFKINGKIMDYQPQKHSKIFYDNVLIGETNKDGSFAVTIRSKLHEKITLRFAPDTCEGEFVKINLNYYLISNIPVYISCE